MRNFTYILKASFWRIIIAFAVLGAIYNPWFSIATWLGFDDAATQFEWSSLQVNWPAKLLVALIAFAIVFWFVKTAHEALGKFGLLIVGLFLAVSTYVPFYYEWMEPTTKHITYLIYYMDMSILFGIGATAIIAQRVASGLITTLKADAPTHHGGIPDHSTSGHPHS